MIHNFIFLVNSNSRSSHFNISLYHSYSKYYQKQIGATENLFILCHIFQHRNSVADNVTQTDLTFWPFVLQPCITLYHEGKTMWKWQFKILLCYFLFVCLMYY